MSDPEAGHRAGVAVHLELETKAFQFPMACTATSRDQL